MESSKTLICNIYICLLDIIYISLRGTSDFKDFLAVFFNFFFFFSHAFCGVSLELRYS
jgi:hypothetical protein